MIKRDILKDKRFKKLSNRQKVICIVCMGLANEDGEFSITKSDLKEYGIYGDRHRSSLFISDMKEIVDSGLLDRVNDANKVMSTVYGADEVVRTKDNDTFTNTDSNFVEFVLEELKVLHDHYMALNDDLMLICPELDALRDVYDEDSKELAETIRATIGSGKLGFNYLYDLEEGGNHE